MTPKYDFTKIRNHEVKRYAAGYDCLRRPTQLRCLITCPFCETDVIAYVWSLAGGGKKCPTCGALHVCSETAPLAAPAHQ